MVVPGHPTDGPTDLNASAPIRVEDDTTGPHSAAYRLICVAGPDVGRTFKVDTPTVTIGRGPVDIALHATNISRNHARLFRRGNEQYAIEDLGSSNKTFVNGQALTASTTLYPGDRIQVGDTVLVFTHHDDLEERMRQLQTAEGLAAFAAGIAHDFNNTLSVILGGLALVEQKLHGQLTDVVQDMRNSATLSSQLAGQLMQLGRATDRPDPGPVRLSMLIHRTAGLLRRRFPARVVIDASVPEGLIARGLEADLHLVLMNLIHNARDAMPDGGTVTVTAKNVSLDATQAAAMLLAGAGSYVELAVKDNGSGMDADTKARAFEPFFTTKPPGQGSGLGLALVHGIVMRHGGVIPIVSAVGAGSTITFWLPAA